MLVRFEIRYWIPSSRINISSYPSYKMISPQIMQAKYAMVPHLLAETSSIYLFCFKRVVSFWKDYFEEVKTLFRKVCEIHAAWAYHNNKGRYGVANDPDMPIFSC